MDPITPPAIAAASAAAAETAAGLAFVYHTIIPVIIITGGFGGFVRGIMRKDDLKWRTYTMSYAFSDKTRALGFLGDILVGVAAGLSISFFVESLFGLSLTSILSANEIVRLVALGIICGYMGPDLLDAVSLMISTKLIKTRETFEKEREELALLKSKVERHSKADKVIFLGNAYKKWGQYEDALGFYDQAADIDPDDPNPFIQKSILYAMKAKDANGKALYDTAISYLDKALKVDEKSWRAYYNRACYKCLSGHSTDEVLKDLAAAFDLDSDGYLRRAAGFDHDFDSVRKEEGFKKLLESASPPQDKSNQAPPQGPASRHEQKKQGVTSAVHETKRG